MSTVTVFRLLITLLMLVLNHKKVLNTQAETTNRGQQRRKWRSNLHVESV